MDRLAGKTVLITGAGSGIGKASALMMAAEGAAVVASDIGEPQALATADEIRAAGGRAMGLALDVTRSADWQAAVQRTFDSFGRLDILVNNAGRLLARALEDTSEAEWASLQETNVTSVFLGCRIACAAMRRTGGGAIVNVSSIYGQIAGPGFAAYVASKGGVRLLTRAAAADFAKYNIRVNSVHPGVIETEMTKDLLADPAIRQASLGTTLMGRPGRPAEIAAAITFLASDEASFMTGAELVVDGGYTAL